MAVRPGDITFVFGEGQRRKSYAVSGGADNSYFLVLPDGTLLEAQSWSKGNPPRPIGLHEVEVSEGLKRLSPEALAVKMNAYMAEEILK